MVFRVFATAVLAGLAAQARVLPQTLIVSQAQFYQLHDTPRRYLGRWVDQPLLIDNAAAGKNPFKTRMTPAELTASRRQALAAGLDGFAFFPKPELFDLGAAAGVPEARHVPIICLWMHAKTEMESFGRAISDPRGVRIGGKTLILSYWTEKYNTPEQVKTKLAAARERWGDSFLFVPDIQSVANHRLRNTFTEKGGLTDGQREDLKRLFRDYLRVSDGIYAGETHMMSRHENGDRVFFTEFYREIAGLMRAVVDEPEFAGRKLLGLSALLGHENAYLRGCNTSHDGTRTLRNSFSVAASMDPDFIMIPEWDEYNENTCAAPTLYNSFSTERVLRCLTDRHRGRSPHVRQGDDASVPNLVVSYRKSLSPGEDLCVEVLNVPDGTWRGGISCRIEVTDERGGVLSASDWMALSADDLSEARYRIPSHPVSVSARAPRIRMRWKSSDGREGCVFDGLHPVDLAPANSWNRKWVKQPVRDLAGMVAASVSMKDGKVEADLECREPIRFAMLCGNGRIQYIHGRQSDAAMRFRESDTHAVFEVSAFYPKTLLSKSFNLSVPGVKDAEWAFGDKVTKGPVKFTSWISAWAEPLFLRLPMSALAGARLKIDYQDAFRGEIPLAAAFAQGAYVVGGRKGIQFSAARFKGQSQYPSVWNESRCRFSVKPDADRESMVYHVQLTTMSGRTWRSAPVVAGRSRPPVLEYDFSPVAGNAVFPRSGERFFCAVAGGPHTVASLWNRGPSTKGVIPAGSAYWSMVEDACPERETQDDGQVALAFDGRDDYVSLPHGTIPAASDFELSMEISPSDPGRKEMVFASRIIDGGGSLWGVWHQAGRVHAAYTSMDPDGVDKGWCEVSVDKSLRYGAWNKITVARRSGRLEISVNGSGASRPCGELAAYTTDCILGGWPGKGFMPFTGRIRRFAVRHLAAGLPSPPRSRRTASVPYFVELPLSSMYSNGNTWTGWTGRWVDWPLMIDRSIEYVVGSYYCATWPDFRKSLQEMHEGGLDGAIFNVSRRHLSVPLAKALDRGEKIPVLTVPDYPPLPRSDGRRAPPEVEDEPWFAPGLYNRNGYFLDGKPLVTSYSAFMATEADILKRCGHLRRKYGDFHFVPDFSVQSVSGWKEKARKGTLGEKDFEIFRERIRRILRIADGGKFANYTSVTDVFRGERTFDAGFFRKYLKPLILQVYAEPEFRGKLLSMNVGMGHMNTYSGLQRCSSSGTKTLRDTLECALELNPDFITFFEWDEWNENTGIRPTLWNSFAARRIVRAVRAAAEGRSNEPLAGDDLSVPNIIVSFRKTLALGDSFCVELLSVPDSAAKGKATVRLALRDENGLKLAAFPPKTLDLTRMDEHRICWDSSLAGDSCVVVPELEVVWPGGRRVWSDGLPFAEVRPTANWDRKWVLMPLRDLIDGASCSVSPEGTRDGAMRIRIKAQSPKVMDRLEVLDGGDVVYSMSGDERDAFREDGDHYVFASMNFCSVYTRHGGEISVEGAKDAEWMIGTMRTRGLSRRIYPQARYTADTYLRIRKDEATNATVRLLWRDLGEFSVPLRKVLENGVHSVSGTNGLCFGVHRFNRQAAFFAPVAAKRAESVADIVPDLPVSVVSGHALTADGKIFRSRPVVVGARSGRKIPVRVWSEERGEAVDVLVDSARVPYLSYDVSGERSGTVALSGHGWAFNGILGGSTAVATRRNRGGDSRQHCCTERYAGRPSRAPAVSGGGMSAEMEFDGSGRYFVMPGGTIPTTCAYRFSFEFLPQDAGQEQEIFACGSPRMWGVIGYLRIGKDGRLAGVGLSAHHRGDAYFRSPRRVKHGEWNRVEIVSDVDGIEMFLNGEGSGKVPLLQPGRFNANCWFGGREGMLFRGKVRNVRIRHGQTVFP